MKKKIKLTGLWTARAVGLFALSRWLTRSRIRIICYHGGCFGDESKFNPKLFIRTETFKSRMQWLRRTGFAMVSLDSAVRSLNGGANKLPLSTVLTFDDGWRSTGAKLLPVLSELNLPSTLYLCTEHVVDQAPVIPVTLRYIFWKSTLSTIRIDSFDPHVDGSYDLDKPGVKDKLASRAETTILRRATGTAQLCRELERFAACVGVSAAELALHDRRFAYMSKQELSDAAVAGCAIELHGHVHRYPIGDPVRFKDDLQTCMDEIVGAGLARPKHYCYPSGSFDSGASPVLSQLGVISATTCHPGLIANGGSAELHYLPRFLDGEDVHMLEFEAELSGFTDALRRLRPSKGAHTYAA
jgi:peptidoglycan/xylan/chitin deacetylase (PgdA/CDA1 family)